MRLHPGPMCFALLPIALAAQAQENFSAWSTFDVDKTCKRISAGRAEEDYGAWRCPGHAGIAVVVSAGDQRTYVSFGPNAEREPAAGETLPGFNDVDKGTIEWRLDTAGKPFAAIARWNFMRRPVENAHEEKLARGQMLVVTRLPPGPVCHVGYVDANLNPSANDLARKLADETARGFACGKDKPVRVGKTQEAR